MGTFFLLVIGLTAVASADNHSEADGNPRGDSPAFRILCDRSLALARAARAGGREALLAKAEEMQKELEVKRFFGRQEGRTMILVDRETGKFRAGQFVGIDREGTPKVTLDIDGDVRAYPLEKFDLDRSVKEGGRFAFTSAGGNVHYGKFSRRRSSGNFRFTEDGTSTPFDVNWLAVKTIHNPDERLPVPVTVDPAIVAANQLMKTAFKSQQTRESMGGNAGDGTAVNMAVDPTNGKIEFIGNYETPIIRDRVANGTVRKVAVIERSGGDTYLATGVDLNPVARGNLDASLRAFGLRLLDDRLDAARANANEN